VPRRLGAKRRSNAFGRRSLRAANRQGGKGGRSRINREPSLCRVVSVSFNGAAKLLRPVQRLTAAQRFGTHSLTTQLINGPDGVPTQSGPDANDLRIGRDCLHYHTRQGCRNNSCYRFCEHSNIHMKRRAIGPLLEPECRPYKRSVSLYNFPLSYFKKMLSVFASRNVS
jgi:hypothetical protein